MSILRHWPIAILSGVIIQGIHLPVRALQVTFGVPEGLASIEIDNSLIQSGMTQFSSDDINFWFSDGSFLTTTTASTLSASITGELGVRGYVSFRVNSSDVWTDEPWGDRFLDTRYAGTLSWADGHYWGSMFWLNRPDRVTYQIPTYPGATPPDRIVAGNSSIGTWFLDDSLNNGFSYSDNDPSFYAYVYDFPISEPPMPTSPPNAVPEPSSSLGLLLLGGSCLLKLIRTEKT